MTVIWMWMFACTGAKDPDVRSPDDTDTVGTTDTDTDTVGTTDTTGSTTTPCAPEGTFDCPIRVTSIPYDDARDTRDSPSDAADAYACAPGTDESGPEYVYRYDAPSMGILAMTVDSDPGVDIDVHLLADADPDACLARDHIQAAWVVQPGPVWLVADSWSDGGAPLAGGYGLHVDFWPLDSGPCATTPTDLDMYWDFCADNLDCEPGATPVLHTPSVGPVVKEAHLVTDAESFPNDWPTSFTDQIGRHYGISEDATGYVMDRTEPWAPAGEGGSEYGQGSTGAPVPVEDEAWYVNMYWKDKPAKGTRMLIVNPFTGAAVIASGGWETGPGDEAELGGACEEIHDALGTGHEDVLMFGFAADQTLDLGPITCW